MSWRSSLRVFALGASGLVLAVGCGSPAGSTGPPGDAGAPLTLFAAASLRAPIEEAARRFEARHPGLTVQVSFASSTALRTQIEQGAAADIFLSADTANPDALLGAGLANGPAIVFARTSLAIVVPLDDRAGIVAPVDLARPGIRVIAAGDGVPITMYAAALLDGLELQAGYPPGFSEAVLANVVTREADVRAVLTKVELGEGDAGIVYATDALVSAKVRSIPIPPGANVVVSYAGVVLAAAPHPGSADAFLAWLAGPDGQAVLAEFGFEAAP